MHISGEYANHCITDNEDIYFLGIIQIIIISAYKVNLFRCLHDYISITIDDEFHFIMECYFFTENRTQLISRNLTKGQIY